MIVALAAAIGRVVSQQMIRTCLQTIGVAMFTLVTAGAVAAEELIDVPEIDGQWWQIAPNAPDVGQWSTGQENACDFAIVRSSDGKWLCVACIRGTLHYGQRLFYRWEADRLTDTDWRPCGIFGVPRGKRGTPLAFTSVQAPHPFVHDGKYYLFYNSCAARCMISDDGRQWCPHVNTDGSQEFFPLPVTVAAFTLPVFSGTKGLASKSPHGAKTGLPTCPTRPRESCNAEQFRNLSNQ